MDGSPHETTLRPEPRRAHGRVGAGPGRGSRPAGSRRLRVPDPAGTALSGGPDQPILLRGLAPYGRRGMIAPP